MAAQLARMLAIMEAEASAELREARADAAHLGERLGRAEAERDQAREQTREVQARLAQAEQRAGEAERLATWWTEGGPLRRAWRALTHRPVR